MSTPPPIYTGDFREIFRHPLALVGGLLGTIVVVGGTLLAAIYYKDDCEQRFRASWQERNLAVWNEEFEADVYQNCTKGDEACRERLRSKWLSEERVPYSLEYGLAVSEECPRSTESDEFAIDFEPGALVKLGQKIDEKEIPEKIITQETRAEEEETPAETVTEKEQAPPKPEEKKKEPEEKPKNPVKKPAEQKDKKLPTSANPTTKNTPFNDLPTADFDRGDPFGDPGGWADRAKDGDPWATAVMKALNNMPVGAYGAKGAEGDFKFQLTICKDGRISEVVKKGGSLPSEGQNAVVLALNQTKIPKPPPDVASKMKSSCSKIRYTFVWSNRGVN